MEQFNLISNYVKIRDKGWTILIHKQFQDTNLIALIRERLANNTDSGWQKVGSSDTAKVYCRPIMAEDKPVIVYVKEYLSRSTFDLLKHLFRPSRAMRSFSAGLLLEANGLNSPKIAAVLEKRKGVFCEQNLLVTCEIENERTANILISNNTDLHDHREMITGLGRTIGRMHAAGIFHGDLRGGNILVSKKDGRWVFYFIDNERTTKYKRLPSLLRYKNLVQLNMQQRHITNTDRMRFLKAYRNACGFNIRTAKYIASKVNKRTLQRFKKRAKTRMGMQDTLPGVSQWDYHRVHQENRSGVFFTQFCQRSSASEFLLQVEPLMKTGTVLKDDTATHVVRCNWNGRDIVIKRYNYQGLWHSLRHTIKSNRAQKSWQFGHLLVSANIPCAIPLGKIEERFMGIIKQSYIINEFIEGPLLLELMNRPEYSDPERQAVMEKSRQLMAELGRRHLTHGDMKPANLIIRNGQPVLIDLDSMEQHRIRWYFRYRYDKMFNYFHTRLHGKKKQKKGQQ